MQKTKRSNIRGKTMVLYIKYKYYPLKCIYLLKTIDSIIYVSYLIFIYSPFYLVFFEISSVVSI